MYLGQVDIAPAAIEIYDDNYGRSDAAISVIISSWQLRLRFRLYSRCLLEIGESSPMFNFTIIICNWFIFLFRKIHFEFSVMRTCSFQRDCYYLHDIA